MNKIGFAFSGILVIIGIITLLQTTIINLVMPKIGRAAFQCAMAGSYSPNDYHIDFLGINIAAVCLIIIGIVLGYIFYKKETGK
jgi:hypothetical protein